MTRDEALALLPEIVDKASDEDGYVSYAVANCCEQLRTYITNSIPTPTVEVAETMIVHPITKLRVNGLCIEQYNFRTGSRTWIDDVYTNLRTALEIGGAS